jgi:hypothetical protein
MVMTTGLSRTRGAQAGATVATSKWPGTRATCAASLPRHLIRLFNSDWENKVFKNNLGLFLLRSLTSLCTKIYGAVICNILRFLPIFMPMLRLNY